MLLCGCTFAVCAYVCCLAGTRAAYVSLAVSALVFVLYAAVKPLRKFISIPAAALSVLMASLIFLTFFGGIHEDALLYEGQTEFTGKVVSVPEISDGRVSFDVVTHSLGNEFVEKKMRCTAEDASPPEIYDCIAVSGAYIYAREDVSCRKQAALYSEGISLGAFFSDGYQVIYSEKRTPYYYLLRLRQLSVNEILNGIPGDAGTVVAAMVTGEQCYVSSDVKNAFSNSGGAHILAVSGLHLVLFTALLQLILGLFKLSERVKSLLIISLSFVYCAFTGFQLSCLRAWIMLTLVYSAPLFSRRADGLNSLGLAVFLITLVNPYTAASLGFQLSVFSTMGILVLGRRLSTGVHSALKDYSHGAVKKLVLFVADTFSITLGVTVFLLPITVFEFGKVSFAAPFTNLLIIPAAYIAMTAGALGAAFSFIPFVSAVLFDVSRAAAEVILRSVTVLSGFGFSSMPVKLMPFLIWLLVSAVFFAVAAAVKFKRHKPALLRAVSLISAVCFFAAVFSSLLPHPKSIRAYAVQAGSGVCVLVENGNSYAVIAYGANPARAYTGLREYMAFVPLNYIEALVMTGETVNDRQLFDTLKGYFDIETAFLSRELYRRSGVLKLKDGFDYGDYAHFFLWDEIEIEVFNTADKKYAIMRYGGRMCLISFAAGNDTVVMRTDTTPASLVCAHLPKNCDCSFDSIIISAGEYKAEDELNRALKLSENVYHTSLYGTVRIW